MTMSTLHFSAALLEQCTLALTEVVHFNYPADAVLSRFFRNHREAGRQDRALIAETVYAVLRRWRLLHAIVPEAGSRQLVLAAWISQLGAGPGDLQGMLRQGEIEWAAGVESRARAEQPFEVQCDLPDWLIAALRRRWDDASLLGHARALQQPASLDLRVNLLKRSREEALAMLAADGIQGTPTPYSPAGIRVQGNPAINRHALFLSGDIEVQDEGSQLLAWLVEPRRGEMIVDLCAGAGGKTLAMGALMRSTGRLYALDVSARRLEKLRPRLARSGLQNVHPQRIESERDTRVKRLAGKIDRVLVDAPCSGLGTLRRNPDLKLRQTPQSVAEMRIKQAAILDAAATLPKQGGRLVYATCSLLQEENEEVVASFLERHRQFSLVPAGAIMQRQKIAVDCDGAFLELWPARHGTDAFFAAVLERTS